MTARSSLGYHKCATICHVYVWLTSDQSDDNLYQATLYVKDLKIDFKKLSQEDGHEKEISSLTSYSLAEKRYYRRKCSSLTKKQK